MIGYFGGLGAIIVQFVFGILLLIATLRVLLPVVGARFRNPICQLVYRVTNPVVTPLARVIPNWRNVSLAAILVVILLVILENVLLFLLAGLLPQPGLLARLTLHTLLTGILYFYLIAIFIYSLLSFVSTDYDNPVVEVLMALVTPILRPFRTWPPQLPGLSLTPMWASLVIVMLLYTVNYVGL